MKFSSACVLALLPIASQAAGGTFSYDPSNPYGPTGWASVDIAGNQCGGSAQSGIDVPQSSCDVMEDYVFSVRNNCYSFDLDLDHPLRSSSHTIINPFLLSLCL
jgi:hypothetical protein